MSCREIVALAKWVVDVVEKRTQCNIPTAVALDAAKDVCCVDLGQDTRPDIEEDDDTVLDLIDAVLAAYRRPGLVRNAALLVSAQRT